MEQSQLLNHLFERLDQTASIIEQHEEVSYLEALCLTADNITEATIKQADIKDQLEPLYADFFVDGMRAEDIRKAFQLALLKGMKQAAQPQHQMTPDGIAIFMSYLLNKLPLPENYRLLDPVVGSANLLTTALNHVDKRPGQALGVEIDDLLINTAHANVTLQQQDVELYHQDALRPLLIQPADVVVTDLPVGTYYNKEHAKSFMLGKSQQPYSHYLLIEQSLNYLNPSGYFIGLVPNNLFEGDKDKQLHQLLQSQAVILGLIELPESLFKDTRHAKSILLLQKNGQGIKRPEQALLVKLPSFKNHEAIANIMEKINQWFKHNM
ncbi:adenine-specific DNA methyltransferase [Pullulanibacillus camelliae]|uniref:Adenine-specific DNA methyltransferase n=1 Tax=Pullulanibacillus camelliae TaxID=1707096 RepID=A0A8J2YLI3_9BACL|nr:class I SAM-dependent methyltransferase [Pullulanibacillus camelliae]GGE52144.1 adenine-specific DNA methyltransferase [Pullulanibacillus camelliae]